MTFHDILHEILWPGPEARAIANLILSVLIVIAFGAALLFSLIYGLLVRPIKGKKPAGRAVQWFVLSLAAILFVIVVGRAVSGDYPGRVLLNVVVFSTVSATMVRLLIVLVIKYLRGPRDHSETINELQEARVEPYRRRKTDWQDDDGKTIDVLDS